MERYLAVKDRKTSISASRGVAHLSRPFFRQEFRQSLGRRQIAYNRTVERLQEIDPRVTAVLVQKELEGPHYSAYRKLDLHFGEGYVSKRFRALCENGPSEFHAFRVLLEELRKRGPVESLNDGNLEQLLVGYGHPVSRINSDYKIDSYYSSTFGLDLLEAYSSLRDRGLCEFDAVDEWEKQVRSAGPTHELFENEHLRYKILDRSGLAEEAFGSRLRIRNHWTAAGIDFESEFAEKRWLGWHDERIIPSLVHGPVGDAGLPPGRFDRPLEYYLRKILHSYGLLDFHLRESLEARPERGGPAAVALATDREDRVDFFTSLDDMLKHQRLSPLLHSVAVLTANGESPEEIVSNCGLGSTDDYRELLAELGGRLMSGGLA